MPTTRTHATRTVAAAGVTIPDQVLHAPSAWDHGRHDHGLSTVVGYVVTETMRAGQILPEFIDHAHVDGACNYGVALAVVDGIRAPHGSYGVIHTLYACGCRAR